MKRVGSGAGWDEPHLRVGLASGVNELERSISHREPQREQA